MILQYVATGIYQWICYVFGSVELLILKISLINNRFTGTYVNTQTINKNISYYNKTQVLNLTRIVIQ